MPPGSLRAASRLPARDRAGSPRARPSPTRRRPAARPLRRASRSAGRLLLPGSARGRGTGSCRADRATCRATTRRGIRAACGTPAGTPPAACPPHRRHLRACGYARLYSLRACCRCSSSNASMSPACMRATSSASSLRASPFMLDESPQLRRCFAPARGRSRSRLSRRGYEREPPGVRPQTRRRPLQGGDQRRRAKSTTR